MFNIDNIICDIDEAYIDAFIDEDAMEINWGVKIKAKAGSSELSFLKPTISSEVFLKTGLSDLESWRELSGKNVYWSEKYDKEGEMIGSIYVFSHEPIYKSSITLNMIGNNNFFLKWISKCQSSWNEKDSFHEVDIKIETEVLFKGIWLARKSEMESMELVDKFIDAKDFEYTVTKDGVSLLIPRRQ